MIGAERAKQIKALIDADLTVRQIADLLKIQEDSVRRYARVAEEKPHRPLAPKILLFDIETLPMEIFVWGLFKQHPTYEQVIKEWCVLSWAAKWLYDSEIMSNVISPGSAIQRNDQAILRGIWDLLNEADIVIAHNGERFDLRKLNARFKIAGFNPPMPYQTIDTLKHSRKVFGFSSHKLDALNGMLDKTQKLKTEYRLWKRCAGVGDGPEDQAKALEEMVTYNRQDVVALEELYLELRPWMRSHPNLGLYVDTDNETCPNCGGTNVEWRGWYYTPMGRYKAFRCECGAIGRQRTSNLKRYETEGLLRSVAR